MKSTFHLQVMSLRKVLFNGPAEEVHLFGDEGEYDLLPYHYPLMGALPEGEIQIKGRGNIPIRAGVALFNNNTCIIIIEEASGTQSITTSSLSDTEVLSSGSDDITQMKKEKKEKA